MFTVIDYTVFFTLVGLTVVAGFWAVSGGRLTSVK